MITVLPKAGEPDSDLAKQCLWHTRICAAPTLAGAGLPATPTPACCRTPVTAICGYAHSCGEGHSACDPTVFCPGGSHHPWVINDAEDLAALRTELQETLKGLEKVATTLPSGIQSKDDAAALTTALNDALGQVAETVRRLKLK